ncbi:TRAM domain-containing protein, partial [Balneolaceae bacterium ANBcel3]|nr:TRAM domain-containing protein [Balneolaceae bacterium ANBcel3]
LDRMRRPYTRETYLELIGKMREYIPGVSLSTDIITGFCGETEQQHQDTLNLMKEVKYDLAYMFAYSERERTLAHRKFPDDVPEDVKKRRLAEIIDVQQNTAAELNKKEIGNRHVILVEKTSKRSEGQMSGRTDTNKMAVFDKMDLQPGDYAEVEVIDATAATLIARPVRKTTLSESIKTESISL